MTAEPMTLAVCLRAKGGCDGWWTVDAWHRAKNGQIEEVSY